MKAKLNALQTAQLRDVIKDGQAVRLNKAPRSMQKGHTDTPLFLSVEKEKQKELF